ncbi:MAG: response regulator [Chloroflexi bacterium]|nr:response regulator [Chloroflexota bacterium]
MSAMLPPDTQILVIEDEPGLLTLLSKMLGRIGAEPATADTGNAGLDLLKEQVFDLIILDLMLPDIDGFEILANLRKDDRHEKTPVLILSARADPESISKGLELGADGYLTKPYLPNTLTDRVRAMLNQGRREF